MTIFCLQSFQPTVHLARIFIGPVLRNRTLYHSISIPSQVVSPVTVLLISAVNSHTVAVNCLQCDGRRLYGGGDHFDSIEVILLSDKIFDA